MPCPDHRRWLLLLIAVPTALRLGEAVGLGLGIDESYMVAAGRTLRWGYFDHPPLSWWLAHAAAWLFGSDAALTVRLPFIALFALSTWIMFRLGTRVASPAAGLWAAAAFNAAPVFGLTTGAWVLPDGPLVAALLGGALLLMRALEAPPERHAAWGAWLGAGLCLGLALLSKYTAVLTGIGVFGFLLTSPAHRRWLGRPQPWVALALALAMFAPVVVWNAGHGWASLLFQGGRAAANRLHPFAPLEVIAGSALFVLPWIWVGLMVALWRGLKAGPANWRGWLLCCQALPPLVLFPTVSLWSRHVLFHWPAPGYLFLFPLLGAELVALWQVRPRLLRLTTVATAALMVVGIGVTASEVRWNWLVWLRPGLDPGMQALDWLPMRDALATRGLLGQPNLAVGASSWWMTGKLDYALGGRAAVICLNRDARQYRFVSAPRAHDGEDVLLIEPIGNAAKTQKTYQHLFAGIEPLSPLKVQFPHRPPTEFALFLGHNLHARLEAEGPGEE